VTDKARDAAAGAMTDALKNDADKIYWWDGVDLHIIGGGKPEWTEYAGGVKLADRFDMQAIANAAIDAYLAARREEGFVEVPRELTDALFDAVNDLMPSLIELQKGIEKHGDEVFYEVIPGPIELWDAMLKAAEPPPARD